jgi:hypothetical protein
MDAPIKYACRLNQLIEGWRPRALKMTFLTISAISSSKPAFV